MAPSSIPARLLGGLRRHDRPWRTTARLRARLPEPAHPAGRRLRTRRHNRFRCAPRRREDGRQPRAAFRGRQQAGSRRCHRHEERGAVRPGRLHAPARRQHARRSRRPSSPSAASTPRRCSRPSAWSATFPSVLVVHPSVPANSVAELDRLRQGASGRAEFRLGRPRCGPASARRAVQAQDRHGHRPRPLQGQRRRAADLLGGNIQLVFAAAPTALAFIQERPAQLLATTGKERLPTRGRCADLARVGHPTSCPRSGSVCWRRLARRKRSSIG